MVVNPGEGAPCNNQIRAHSHPPWRWSGWGLGSGFHKNPYLRICSLISESGGGRAAGRGGKGNGGNGREGGREGDSDGCPHRACTGGQTCSPSMQWATLQPTALLGQSWDQDFKQRSQMGPRGLRRPGELGGESRPRRTAGKQAAVTWPGPDDFSGQPLPGPAGVGGAGTGVLAQVQTTAIRFFAPHPFAGLPPTPRWPSGNPRPLLEVTALEATPGRGEGRRLH